MDKKTVFITGASRGIGRATAVEFAKENYNIVVNYAGNVSAAEETAELCRNVGSEVLVLQGNVADSDDCNRMVKEAIDTFGAIDVLVNNAGITKDNLLLLMKEEEFDDVIAANLKGSYNMMKAVVRPMIRKKKGSIINLASVVGLMGNAGQMNYAASKAGVIGMTKSLAREIASKNITVNAVAPGFIETDMTEKMTDAAKDVMNQQIPLGRGGKPEEVAAAIHFLASDAARYITGQVLCVDGGMCM